MFEETARELVPGAVGEWIDARGFPYESMAQLSSFTDLEASALSPNLASAARYRSAVRFRAAWISILVPSVYAVSVRIHHVA